MKTLRSKKTIARSPLQSCVLVIVMMLASFTLSQMSRAVSPPPDGGYPGDNTAEGTDALFSLTGGRNNTANGQKTLYQNTTGNDNTANGEKALYSNITGSQNTANGSRALFSNTTGIDNTANGFRALLSNTTGSLNTANGARALLSNTTGSQNTANGLDALYSNTIGIQNTANGSRALTKNTDGSQNTATGDQALFTNTTGSHNTANGSQALGKNTTGFSNTANGSNALWSNTTGIHNTATGLHALIRNSTGSENTGNGFRALYSNTTGSYNIALGEQAGGLIEGSYNIDIGNSGYFADNNIIRIGYSQTATYIAGISGNAVAGTSVVVDGSGQLGVLVSSERFKEEIKPMDQASEALLSLRPVTFRYKRNIDPKGIPQFGLAAEEVEKVDPTLVTRDDEGKAFTVRYEAVNAMLLNEFLKEHKTVQEQGATITHLQKQIEALTAGLQKVSAQLESSKSALQVANNP